MACSITIHTDSKYVIGVLAHQWKPKQNVALIARHQATAFEAHRALSRRWQVMQVLNSMNALMPACQSRRTCLKHKLFSFTHHPAGWFSFFG
jgi:ribonuclease HI